MLDVRELEMIEKVGAVNESKGSWNSGRNLKVSRSMVRRKGTILGDHQRAATVYSMGTPYEWTLWLFFIFVLFLWILMILFRFYWSRPGIYEHRRSRPSKIR